MRRLGAWLAAWIAIGHTVVAAPRPNVLFIFSDDQRADTIHALGNSRIDTPNLDRLVARGTAFTRAFCQGGFQGAVCVPARASLMSGRSLFHANEQLKGQGTWPEQFGRAGYDTFAAGKWHNGTEALLRSFKTGGPLFLGGMGNPYTLPFQAIGPDGKLVPREHPANEHAVRLIADSAVAFLGGRKGNAAPFLMYVAMEAPHDPRLAPQEYHAKYNAAPPPLPPNFLPQHPFDNGEMTVRDEQLAPWPRTPANIRQQLADYYASIDFMDAQIGRVLEALKASGHDADTLMVFSSDQGLALGSHGLMGKQNLYEDAMRVPLVIAGPGLPAGRRLEAFCYLGDIFPTLGDLAGVPGPTGSEGLSLGPVLLGRTNSMRRIILTAYREVQRAVRDDRWKLIRYPRIDKTQLFDLQNDPNETRDLAENPAFGAKLAEMSALLERELRAAGDTAALHVAHPGPAAWTPPPDAGNAGK